jgi:hypothetical protein
VPGEHPHPPPFSTNELLLFMQVQSTFKVHELRE